MKRAIALNSFPDAITERLSRLDAEFFERLEREGKRAWTPNARQRLSDALERYLRLALDLPKDHKPSGRARQKLRNKATLVREAVEGHQDRNLIGSTFRESYCAIEDHFSSDFQRLLKALKTLESQAHHWPPPAERPRDKIQNKLKHLRRALETYPDRYLTGLAFRVAYGVDEKRRSTDIQRLLEGLRTVEQQGRQGLPPRPALKHLIFEIARIYCLMEGRVALSREGPFARVLRLVHEVIPPPKGFAKTPDGLVRFAEERRKEIKDHVRRYPLALQSTNQNPKN